MRSRQYYKDRVAARIDEAVPVADTVSGQTAIEDPQAFIDDELDYSARHVLRTASVELVMAAAVGDGKHFHGQETEYLVTRIDIRSDLSALVPCPEDFLRLVSLKLTGWKRELVDLQSIRHPDYKYEREETFLSGSVQKPKGYLYPFADKDYLADEWGKYSLATIFTSNQTLSDLNDSNGSLSTGDVFVLNSQTDDDEDGTYLTPASGSPTKLSHLHDVVTILTFSSLPSFVVGETISQATSGATGKILTLDSTNNKVVVTETSAASGTDFNTANVITGASSAATGTPTAEGNYTRAENPRQAIEVFRAASDSDTIERFVYVPILTVEFIPDELSDAVIYHCSGRVLETIGELEAARQMYAKAEAISQGHKTGLKGES